MISFDSFLINDRTIVKNNNAYKCFTLKAVEDTSIRAIPQQFANDIDTSMFHPAANADAWNKINIPTAEYNLTYTVNFSGITFSAKLENITAAVKQKKDGTFSTVYTFKFSKELDASVDMQLSSMLNVKEPDENGKMKLVQYATTLEKE